MSPKREFPVLRVSSVGRCLAQFLGLLFLICPAIAFGLGIWQYSRHNWKTGIINDLSVQMSLAPIPLPNDLRELLTLEYKPIKIVGEFLHNEEFVLEPRHRMDGHTDRPFSSAPVGGFVITPFKIADRNLIILVSRGWVPTSKIDKNTRLEGQVSGKIEMVGINRLCEKRPTFAKESNPASNFYAFRDIESMAYYHDTAPVFLEAVYESTVPGGPIGGQTRVSIRNEHFNYMLTWFALSVSTVFMWVRRFYKIR